MGYSEKNKKCMCVECNLSFLSYKVTTKYCSAKCNNLNIYKNRNIEQYNARKRSKSVAPKRKERYHNDDNFRIACILRARLNSAVKNNNKSGSAVKDLGCSIEELKKHLESKFQPGMTWENHSRFGWHIDHIEPLSNFDLLSHQDLKEACIYTNLQPLWWRENIVKGGA